jgi:electron transport complex protein RnfC
MFKQNKRVQGGIHPQDAKFLSQDSAIESLQSLPPKLTILLKQHAGAPARPDVSVGDTVIAGQLIAKANGRFSANLHAPLSGEVIAVETAGGGANIQIRPNENSDHAWQKPALAPHQLSREALIEALQQAGVVGMGGAMFPVTDKLALSFSYTINTLVINGGECEPYLTCDDRLMRERSSQIIGGIRILMAASGAKEAIIGIEENKRTAITRMTDACLEDDNICVQSLPVLYPMGSEKQMIRALTGLQVPSGKLAAELGILMQNVGTCEAVFNAVHYNKPLTHRVITVSGRAIARPANILAPIGTPISHLINQCGGYINRPERMVLGGPMMGKIVHQIHTPITKGSSGLLLLSEAEVQSKKTQSCLRCGRCANACPMQLEPLNLFPLLEKDRLSDAQAAGLMDCLLCGACSYTCPASLPLTSTFNWGKQMLGRQAQQERKADFTRAASEARKERMDAEAAEKAAAKAAKSKRAPRAPRAPRTESTAATNTVKEES